MGYHDRISHDQLQKTLGCRNQQLQSFILVPCSQCRCAPEPESSNCSASVPEVQDSLHMHIPVVLGFFLSTRPCDLMDELYYHFSALSCARFHLNFFSRLLTRTPASMVDFTMTLNPRSLSPNRMEGPHSHKAAYRGLSICLVSALRRRSVRVSPVTTAALASRLLRLFLPALFTFHPEAWLRD